MLGPVIARLRVATCFAFIAALARRGFARVCWMLRLVMRPVRRALRLTERRALRLTERRDFAEEDRFELCLAAIVFPSISMKETTSLQ